MPRENALLLGVAYNDLFDGFCCGIPGDAGSPHVVLFVDSTKAPFILNRPFETLFPGYTESEVGSWIETVGLIGTPPTDPDEFDRQAALLSTFATSLQTFDTTGAGGPVTSLWIPLPADQTVSPSEFTAVMFTDGTEIGRGLAAQHNAVPAPATCGMLGFACLGMVAIQRARKQA